MYSMYSHILPGQSKKKTEGLPGGFNDFYPYDTPEPPRDSSSLSGVTTWGEDDEGELCERSMGSRSPDNWDDDVARLPVAVVIDLAVLRRLGGRSQRLPTRLMGSPYHFGLVTILEGSASSLSTVVITEPPNGEVTDH